jgi:Family of unknown function (DUF6099)
MDAIRLIAATRQAVAHAGDPQELVAEAWQAQVLVEAVGGRLAAGRGPEVRAGPARAAVLTGVRDPVRALRALLEILAEVVAALVAVARAAEEVSVYWQAVEAADAAVEAVDGVRALLARYGAEPAEAVEPVGGARVSRPPGDPP